MTPHGYKEEVKIKYDTVKAVVKKFPNRTGATMELVGAAVPVLDWDNYCALTPAQQIV